MSVLSKIASNMKYDDKHRTLLQIVMHAGIMKDYDFQQAASNIFQYNNSAQFYKVFINNKLDPLGMMISSAQCEFTGEKYWMLASTTVDDVTRFQTQFSQGQLELLRKILMEIITSLDGSVSSTTSLNYCTDLENKLSKRAAETFLNDCVQRMWLFSKDGHYYIGVRSIIELMPYFKATHEEGFNICPLCKSSVFHGQRCTECQVVSHLYCLAKLAQVQNPLKCPNCSNAVPTDDLPEVAAQQDPMQQDENNVEQEAGISSQKRIKRSGKRRSNR